MIRRVLAGAALVVALLASAACGDTVLDHGRVVGKEHRAAYTSVMPIPIMVGNVCTSSKYGSSCTPIFSWIPYVVYHPEQWVLDLRQCKASGKCRTGHAYLDEGTWATVAVGTYWAKHPGDSKPNPDIRLHRA